jgi:hypothetical protein
MGDHLSIEGVEDEEGKWMVTYFKDGTLRSIRLPSLDACLATIEIIGSETAGIERLRNTGKKWEVVYRRGRWADNWEGKER